VGYAHDGNVRILQMKDLHPSHGLTAEGMHSINVSKVSDEQWLKCDDVIFVAKGTRYFAAAIPQVPNYTVASPHLFILRARQSGLCLPEYLAWWINNEQSQRYLNAHAAGTTVKYVRKDVLQALEISLPPIQIQAQIVALASLGQQRQELLDKLANARKRHLNLSLTQFAQTSALL
jgi:restriction endonuclease S subunit